MAPAAHFHYAQTRVSFTHHYPWQPVVIYTEILWWFSEDAWHLQIRFAGRTNPATEKEEERHHNKSHNLRLPTCQPDVPRILRALLGPPSAGNSTTLGNIQPARRRVSTPALSGQPSGGFSSYFCVLLSTILTSANYAEPDSNRSLSVKPAQQIIQYYELKRSNYTK